ncbi:MAG: hypothetical protein H0U27_08860, partial [Nitrosopumilus sp.]|nr:hypothetical protein [Nitrosopumilus sp.]
MVKKIYTLTAGLILTLIIPAMAQDNQLQDSTQLRLVNLEKVISNLRKIKITGYLQAQFQVADSAGARTFAGGNFAEGVDKRFMIRRGRIKFQYDSSPNTREISTSQYVLQLDVTERGVVIKDAYLRLTDKWIGWFSLTAGLYDRPFGFEIPFSSGARESPERGRMSQIIFPNEREVGAMITILPSNKFFLNGLKINGGIFNGTGAPGAGGNSSDFDKYKDFIGRVSYNSKTKTGMFTWGLGASYYDGGYRIDTVNVYRPTTDAFGVSAFMIETSKADVKTELARRERSKRNYAGADIQLSFDWFPGITTIRAEYIQGEQAGTSSSTVSPAAPVISDIYNRNFNGAYFYFIQNIVRTPLQAIVKYDWYDPNTDAEGDEIGRDVEADFRKTTSADVKFSTLGLGLAYNYDSHVRLTAY